MLKTSPNLNRIFVTLMFTCVALFMTVRGATNTCFTLLLLLSLLQYKDSLVNFKPLVSKFNLPPLLIAMCLPVLALLVTQGLRNDWLLKSYDAPIRMLLGIAMLMLFATRHFKFAQIIAYASPVCLILTGIDLMLDKSYLMKWGNRFATSFVDPNSFGTYAVLFTSLSLFGLSFLSERKKWWTLYFGIGITVGIGLIIGSGTRGAWLAMPLILLFWGMCAYVNGALKKQLSLMLTLGLVTLGVGFLFSGSYERLTSIDQELTQFADNSKLNTSAGIRLVMWKMSMILFEHKPWLGYGEHGVKNFLSEPWLLKVATPEGIQTIACCGPHNELLANLIRSGILGGLSVIGLIFCPTLYVIRYINDTNREVAFASQLLIIYLLTMLVCSVTMEVFTLKYTASFYTFMVTGLVGQILFLKNSKLNNA